MYLYLRESPRALILTAGEDNPNAKALVFSSTLEDARTGRATVGFMSSSEFDLTGMVKLTPRPVKGCLGLIHIAPNDLFVAVVTSASELGNICPSAQSPHNVCRIHEVAFYSLITPAFDDLLTLSDGTVNDSQEQLSGASPYEHPCAPITKILSSGTFYYAPYPHWDISSRLSVRIAKKQLDQPDLGDFDNRFVWNEYVIRSLLDFRERLDIEERREFDRSQFVLLVIQGYVGLFRTTLRTSVSSPIHGTLGMISRLGWKRAGTRFNTRGIDDDGNCANFVETEVTFSTDVFSFSYVQVRGSVPLFWEQQGFQTFGQKIQVTRPQAASQPAFDRHFAQLLDEYSGTHAVNLLGTKENESILTLAYAQHLRTGRVEGGETIGLSHFDFHTSVRNVGHDNISRELNRIDGLHRDLNRFGWTVCDHSSQSIISQQMGVFRVNCLDCLDRTNFVQDIFSKTILEKYLETLGINWRIENDLWAYHRELWAESGDALSRIYAGTGALNTSFTRTGKRTLAGVLSDATKSVSRAYINNFQDKAKQAAIDMLLGNLTHQIPVTIFDPIHDSVKDALTSRLPEYSVTETAKIFVGSWNLNGRASPPLSMFSSLIKVLQPPSESLLPWLFPIDSKSMEQVYCDVEFYTHDLLDISEPDIFALGFQEIVPLTAQQIIQTDPEKKRMWENAIIETLAKRPNKKADYVLLRSDQLVGTALIVVVKSNILKYIRNVEGATKKTGLRGMSGNKGAVGIRLEYHDTTFCFLTAHLAAGQSNVDERNNDYNTIANGLNFLRGKTIHGHDNVIWLADTNYRIDLDNETVRTLVASNNFDALIGVDQLKQMMDLKAVFSGFEEGPLLFPPTYRYDVGTDDYDTSEKMRTPSWTDRILHRGRLVLQNYSRAELRGSDHRPVYALFIAKIHKIDRNKQAVLRQQLLDEAFTQRKYQITRKPALNERDVEFDLPPPSSDHQVWWEELESSSGDFIAFAHDRRKKTNPFDSSSESSQGESPSSSDDELYSHAQKLPITV